MKRKILLILPIILAAAALIGCKNDTDLNPQRKITVTGIPGEYNTLEAKIRLTVLPYTEKAEGTATVSGSSATFVLKDLNGNPFTEGGLTSPYQATLTIIDISAGGTTVEVEAYGGVLLGVVLTQETTTVEFAKFRGTRTGK